MYIIHFKAGLNPLEVDREKGDKLKRVWATDPKSDSVVEVEDRMFRLSAIKAIEPLKNSRSEREPEPLPTPLTPEQQVKRAEMLQRIRKDLEARGVVGFGKAKKEVPRLANCVVCGKENPPSMARVCSGECYRVSPNPELV